MPEPRDLRALAGATLCVGFSGAAPDPNVLAELAELGPCGVILFARNVTTRDKTRALVASVSASLTEATGAEPLVCIDQEGGRVARLRFDEPLPSMLALAATRDVALAEGAGRHIGRELARVGANVAFAPVFDLALAPAATALGTRTLGDDPELAGTLGAALVRGVQQTGVAATAKHFPGHGSSALDPHIDFPTRATIDERELTPFIAAFAAGVRCVMSAHVVVRSHGAEPATTSHAILTQLLRERLGFAGVTFSDCLQMDAIARSVGTARGAVLALRAGADALIISHDLALARTARDAIVRAVEVGELDRGRVAEAVARTDALRAVLAHGRALRVRTAAEADDGIVSHIARSSIVRVRGAARLDERPLSIVSFEGGAADGIAATTHERPSLSLALRRRRFRSEHFRVPLDPERGSHEMLLDVLTAAPASAERRLIVIARRAHLHDEQRVLLNALLALTPDPIAVSALEPFDVPCLAAAPDVFATCGDEASSIEALADVLAGRETAGGTLPVHFDARA